MRFVVRSTSEASESEGGERRGFERECVALSLIERQFETTVMTRRCRYA